jgi:hypothetical protein
MCKTIQIARNASVFVDTDTLYICNCASCGVKFAFPVSLREQYLKSGDTFYCPSGHSNVYRKTTAELLREQLAQKEQERLALESRVNYWVKEHTAQYEAKVKVENKLKRVEKRILNGVCSCCNRTFQDLAAHMKTKHPEEVNQINK